MNKLGKLAVALAMAFSVGAAMTASAKEYSLKEGDDLEATLATARADGKERIALPVDFSATCGKVKPVNGVGQPPMVGALSDWSMMHYLKEAGIPYSRLHDVGGWLGGGLYVDIPNLFPDFDADENDPGNYRFVYTDDLMKALTDNGVEPFFRLGVTIENFVGKGFPPVRCMPPKDFAKWARICEHVIRHYTEGWANGFRYKIAYWEIWNEPENDKENGFKSNPCWNGPFDEFVRFYGTVAPYLKEKFPHLKIGGYGGCGFYAGVGSKHVVAANASAHHAHFIECAHAFFKAARDNRWPLDFFSYHSYSEPGEALRQVAFADSILTAYGFTPEKTERIFNEWLPEPRQESLGTAKQAALIAAELIGLQYGPCDVACLYDARCGLGRYSPLFNPLTLKPHKAYYVFKAFNELRKLGTAVKVPELTKGVAIAAATDGKDRAALLVANISGRPWPNALCFEGWKIDEARVIDERRMYETGVFPAEIPNDTVWLVKLRRD